KVWHRRRSAPTGRFCLEGRCDRLSAQGMRSYRYFDLVMAGFVTVLLCSNLIGPAKTCEIPLPFVDGLLAALRGLFGGSESAEAVPTKLVFGAGNLFFPISYIFGDILTEVYGY